MKKLLAKASTIFLGAVLFVGQLSANAACLGEYYQPEVPAQLKKF